MQIVHIVLSSKESNKRQKGKKMKKKKGWEYYYRKSKGSLAFSKQILKFLSYPRSISIKVLYNLM
jgi:hypothetical protein